MKEKFQAAADAARAAWLANMTVADNRWPYEQLHGLYRLLLEIRDDLLLKLNQDYSQRPPLFWEQEFAVLVEDIATLIRSVEAGPNPPALRQSCFGAITASTQPSGVSLILSTSQNPLRFALAPLAASIAARNVVVLSTTQPDGIFDLIQRAALKHLDTFAIHIVPATIPDIRALQFDHIYLIVEEERLQEYSELLRFPQVQWCSASGKHNVAVVDGGKVDLSTCVREISSNLDILTAVVIDDEHFQPFCRALSNRPGERKRGPSSTDLTLNLGGSQQLTSRIYTIDIEIPRNAATADDIQSCLRKARSAGAVLLMKSTSLDDALDVLRQIPNLGQATLLNPRSMAFEKYFGEWTHASVVSVRRIRQVIPEVLDTASGTPVTTFPISLFTQSRAVVSGPISVSGASAQAIRAAYEFRFPKFKREHPGGRVDFFVQVEYAVKASISVLAICGLVGAWYGSKAIRARFL